METRLEAMEQQVFKCQGIAERGLNANHMMITEFKMDANDIGKHLSRLYDRVDQLQGQIYDLQNQNFSDGQWYDHLKCSHVRSGQRYLNLYTHAFVEDAPYAVFHGDVTGVDPSASGM
ncbi:40s ribosomal protein s5-1 [Hordeum vulgare]|nr:40s ribosomal protein s5-1 [Hordeum vulgare]